ncbi:hypothetical protein DPEC_G00111820 [Dallia pectoralis]|uniref:Uncharacterized protein n=1 Tax=Dallia pectoralis TaxID=75939 RepID=A0ACC2GTA1_DALPE|nr:hypothetical protein DPEC_G00111820 [Dallia pectoralis]
MSRHGVRTSQAIPAARQAGLCCRFAGADSWILTFPGCEVKHRPLCRDPSSQRSCCSPGKQEAALASRLSHYTPYAALPSTGWLSVLGGSQIGTRTASCSPVTATPREVWSAPQTTNQSRQQRPGRRVFDHTLATAGIYRSMCLGENSFRDTPTTQPSVSATRADAQSGFDANELPSLTNISGHGVTETMEGSGTRE